MAGTAARLRMAALGAVVAVSAACQATDYKPAISTFAEAAGKADDAFAAMRLTVLAERLAAQQRMILAGQRVLDIKQDGAGGKPECLPTSARCHLVAADPDGKDEQVLSDSEGLDNLRNAMHGIALYAGKLAAIVDAPTAANAKASLTAAEASIKEAAAAASKLPGAKLDTVKLAAVADPAVSIVNWSWASMWSR